MAMMEGRRPTEGAKALIDVGAEMVGAISGNVLGFLLAGPPGLVVGGVGGVAIGKGLAAVGNEIAERFLSPRERVRVGAAIAVSATKTVERLDRGDIPRSDSFVDDGSPRPPVQEITEGLLLAAQRAYDERKVPYIGRLSANLNFSSEFDATSASLLVSLADRISYTKLCLLRLSWLNTVGRGMAGGRIKNRHVDSPTQAALLTALKSLSDDGLLNFSENLVWSIIDVDPPKARLQVFGSHLYNLMELDQIPESDLVPIRSVFRDL